MTRSEIIALIVAKANEHGLVPWEFLGGAIAESGLNPEAWRQGAWPDWSAGAFQQTVLYAPEGDHSASSENVALIKRLYFDLGHACDVAAAQYKHWRYDPEVSALQAWCAYNLPTSYHRWPDVPNVEQRENYRKGLAEAQAILGGTDVPAAPDAPIYDPDMPIVTQTSDWDCAEQSTLWALTAYGRHPSDAWMEQSMLDARVESTSLGLLDASGGRLAAWITEQYGEFGYAARNNGSVSFDDVKSVAGASPVLLGGRNWGAAGHWTGVRRYDLDRDVLVLANPGGTGPVYGQQTLSRQQFAQIGPCSVVVVTHESAAAPPPAPPPPPPATNPLAAWIEALSFLGDDIGDDLDALPARLRAAADTIERSVDELRRVRGDLVGPRPAA